MYGMSDKTITVLKLHTNAYHKIRTTDFHPYKNSRDPAHIHSHDFHTSPRIITKTTPDPPSHTAAKKYPDAQKRAAAHDKELDQMEKEGT